MLLVRLLLVGSHGHVPTPVYLGGLGLLLLYGIYRRATGAVTSQGGFLRTAVVIALVIVGVVAIGFGVKSGNINVPADASTASITSWLNPTASAPGTTSPVVVDHGTSTSAFGKTWVYVDGEKLSGISNVIPASGYQVAVIYDTGGKSVPAASLPQGFLDDWYITPEALKAMNHP